ncbi:hypothetical protein NDU88_001179, partial [Pleurodeles waltl]
CGWTSDAGQHNPTENSGQQICLQQLQLGAQLRKARERNTALIYSPAFQGNIKTTKLHTQRMLKNE